MNNLGRAILLASTATLQLFPHSACVLQAAASAQTQPSPKKKTKESIDPHATAGVRGLGSPVTIQVRDHGKPVGGAQIVVKTDAGVEIRQGETDSAGNWQLKLDSGEYSFTVISAGDEKHISAHIAFTAKVTAITFTVEM
jgi:hypothetical protein